MPVISEHRRHTPAEHYQQQKYFRSDFRMSGQNYSAPQGPQVGSGSGRGSIGVPGIRGPASSSIRPMGQSTPGVQLGGPFKSRQPLPGVRVSGVQHYQQYRRPFPITTPPVYISSPREMDKQAYLQSQSPLLQQSYVPNPSNSSFYVMDPRPQQPNGDGHRGIQGGSLPPFSAGQPTSMYLQHPNISITNASMFHSTPVIHGIPHHQVPTMNNQITQNYSQQPRHQPDHSKPFYSSLPPHSIQPNAYQILPGQPQFFQPRQHFEPTMNSNMLTVITPRENRQNVVAPLVNTEGYDCRIKSSIPQLSSTQLAYDARHKKVTTYATRTYKRSTMRHSAIWDIVDPKTGINIAGEIYGETASTINSDEKSLETPHPQQSSIVLPTHDVQQVDRYDDEIKPKKAEKDVSLSETIKSQIKAQEPSKDGIIKPKFRKNMKSSKKTISGIKVDGRSLNEIKSHKNKNIKSANKSKFGKNIDTKSAHEILPNKKEEENFADDRKSEKNMDTISLHEILPDIKENDNFADDRKPEENIDTKSAPNLVKDFEKSAGNIKPETHTNKTLVDKIKPYMKKDENSADKRKHENNQVTKSEHEIKPDTKDHEISANVIEPETNKGETSVNEIRPDIIDNENFADEKTPEKNIDTKSAPDVVKEFEKSGDNIKPETHINKTLVDDIKPDMKKDENSADKRKHENNQVTKSEHEIKPDTKDHEISANVIEPETNIGETLVNEIKPDIKDNENFADERTPEQNIDTKSASNVKDDEKSADNIISKPNERKKCEDEVKPDVMEETKSTEVCLESSLTSVEMTKKSQKGNGCESQKSKSLDRKLSREGGKSLLSSTNDAKKNSNRSGKNKPKRKGKNKSKVRNINLETESLKTKETLKSEILTEKSTEEAITKIDEKISHEVIKNVEENLKNTKCSEIEISVISAERIPLLKYSYDENQWSPINQEGKKTYSAEFLMKLKDDPKSNIIPPNLPLMNIYRQISCQKTSSNQTNSKMFARNRNVNECLPDFAKSSSNSKRSVSDINNDNNNYRRDNNKPKMRYITLECNKDVKLRQAENAWKPTKLKCEKLSNDNTETSELYNKVRSILNKLTPEKFDKLVDQVKQLQIDTVEKLKGVIDLIFLKAIDEPNFSTAYALMCKELGKMMVAGGDEQSNTQTPHEQRNQNNFRRFILIRCQHEFENNPVDIEARELKLKEIDKCTNLNEKKILKLLFEENDRQIRMKSVGNIRFIGELFKLNMMKAEIMHKCIRHLLKTPHEDNLECLCKLVSTVGKTMDEMKADLSPYFVTMENLIKNKNGDGKISSRIRFMIQDVIDLRSKNWVPRRDVGNPKKMNQILKDVESESKNQSVNTPRTYKQNQNRNDGNSYNGGNGGHSTSSTSVCNGNSGNNSSMKYIGWSTTTPIPTKPSNKKYYVDHSKLSAAKESLSQDIKLGDRKDHQWNLKSVVNGKQNTTTNKFALLNSIPSMDHQVKKVPSTIPFTRSSNKSTGATRNSHSSENKKCETNISQKKYNVSQLENTSFSSRNYSQQSSSVESSSVPQPSVIQNSPPVPSTSQKINKSSLNEANCTDVVYSIIGGFSNCPNVQSSIDAAMDELDGNFPCSIHSLFICEALNTVFERTQETRKRTAALFAHMIRKKLFSSSIFETEFKNILENSSDLLIDIPKFWTYAAEILTEMILRDAYPLSALRNIAECLGALVGKFIGELMPMLLNNKGSDWLAKKWQESGLCWDDLFQSSKEEAEEVIKKYNLDFLKKEIPDV